MFKNRAAWLAVAVLAIASAIMIFVIMPQINGTVGDAGKQPQEAAKKAGDAVGEDVVTAAGKVGRENATGGVRPPQAWETGPKDTVIAYPGEITRVKSKFDQDRQYVWH